MSQNIWTQSSGYSLGTIQEQVSITIPLPVSTTAGMTFTVISGELPSGMFLVGSNIIGAPFLVSNQTTYNFCIRATNGTDISDRTFTIDVLGFNPPTFLTPAGYIPIGPNYQYYTTDQTYVSYQLEVTDLNIATGRSLTFSILDGDGILPPGLTLDKSTGVISGYVAPAPAITINDGIGNYDEARFDIGAFDFGLVPTNGFDSYQYDDVIFDYYTPVKVPQTLSLNYQFRVTVTDGLNYTQRVFKIFVAGSDEFRADSTTPDGQADEFTADSTYVRAPQWLTDNNLGIFRSNNYLTVPVALYNNLNVVFRQEQTNHEIYGLAYQISNTDNIIGSTSVCIENTQGIFDPNTKYYFSLDYYVATATDQLYTVTQVTQLSETRYRLTINTPLLVNILNNTPFYIGTLSLLPTGVNFDTDSGDIYGFVTYQPAITEKYTFTINASRPGDNSDELVSASRTFSLIILGSINSVITWQSPSLLGSIPADYICTLSLVATSSVSGAVINYSLVSVENQSLPPGLSLSTDGEILGVPTQYKYTDSLGTVHPGLITLDNKSTTFDQNTTTFDRTYTFTVQASDQYGYSAITKEFTIVVTTPDTREYNNITCRPYLSPEQRTSFSNFINNNKVFIPSSIYRPTDPNFGIQQDLTMLVYAGIENTAAAAYIGAMGLNVKKKRFYFNDIKTATAYDPITKEAVYEVVYVQMIDPENIKGAPLSIKAKSPEPGTITVDFGLPVGATLPDYLITVDSTGYDVSDPNTEKYFINNITNWQDRLSLVGASERNYLPLWMRSIQSGSKAELGYILAIPLCFCKVGNSTTILDNIKYIANFDFKTLDYTIDRFTITSLAGYISDKYLMFRNDRITV